MEIRQLKYFVAIVEEENISRAAQRLNIAQPPLSKQLMLLESELGIKLFERNTRKLIITEEGKLLYKRAKQILDMVNGTAQEIKEISSGIKGTLPLGTTASLGASLLPERIYQFQKKYPDVRFQVWVGDPIRIMELVENRIVELGIVRLPIDHNTFEWIILEDEPIMAVMSKKWNVGKDSSYIRLSELKDVPLMLLRRQKGTSFFHDHSYISDMVENACLQQGFEPKIICESSDVMTLLTWARYDIGITAVPKSAMNLIPNSGLIFKQIIEPTITARPSALIWLKGRHLSSVSRKFLEYFPINTNQLQEIESKNMALSYKK